MRTPIFQIDAFTTRRFAGNPAAVMSLESFPEDGLLQALAAENNLPATAFLVPEGGDYRLRWFTPTTEIPLCGHGTLASAAVVMERLEPGRGRVVFHSASGPLTVTRTASGYRMASPRGSRGRSRRRPGWSRRWAPPPSRSGPTLSTFWHCWRARRWSASWLPTPWRSPVWTAAGSS